VVRDLASLGMAQLVILVPASGGEPSVSAASVAALARLGVTVVSMAGDASTLALVLEGWALDPTHHEAVLAALGAEAAGARALQPIVQMAVSPATREGEPRR
jgi:hypothetical protein